MLLHGSRGDWRRYQVAGLMNAIEEEGEILDAIDNETKLQDLWMWFRKRLASR